MAKVTDFFGAMIDRFSVPVDLSLTDTVVPSTFVFSTVMRTDCPSCPLTVNGPVAGPPNFGDGATAYCSVLMTLAASIASAEVTKRSPTSRTSYVSLTSWPARPVREATKLISAVEPVYPCLLPPVQERLFTLPLASTETPVEVVSVTVKIIIEFMPKIFWIFVRKQLDTTTDLFIPGRPERRVSLCLSVCLSVSMLLHEND